LIEIEEVICHLTMDIVSGTSGTSTSFVAAALSPVSFLLFDDSFMVSRTTACPL